jgi:hypothetical protein
MSNAVKMAGETVSFFSFNAETCMAQPAVSLLLCPNADCPLISDKNKITAITAETFFTIFNVGLCMFSPFYRPDAFFAI